MTANATMSSEKYLKQPYARRLVPDESGGYVATIQEFPGCVAEGETPAEAVANLEAAAASWIDAALALGQSIPEPVQTHGYSGKVILRMPRGVHRQAAEMALTEGTSLNQLLVTAVASYVGSGGVLDRKLHLGRTSTAINPTANVFISPAHLHLDPQQWFTLQVSEQRAHLMGSVLRVPFLANIRTVT
jgi:predicted RNase H-like HicB family nuclease